MLQRLGFSSWFVGLLVLVLGGPLHAQTFDTGISSRALITQAVDEGNLVELRNSTRPEATPENDRGPVADALPMAHLLLQLRRPPEQQSALEQFLDELQNPASPNFHKWLSPQQFGQNFGVAQQDLDEITRWLQARGFTVNLVYPNRMLIDFSGTAREVREAFHTEIHYLDVRNERHVANMRDPRIPAALAPVIVGIVSLHDFKPRTLHEMRKPRANYTFPDSLGGTNYALVPGDLATIYNLNPLFSAGISGQGQTIALIEDTNVFRTSDWKSFRSKFGLSAYSSGSFSTVHPTPLNGLNNCANPGVVPPNDAEAILDAEWASAAAPSATILMASCADTATTFGGLIALQNLINANSPPPALVSISYGQCETENGAPANAAYNSIYQQGVAEGVSIFVAAGDSGAAGCDNGVTQATHGIGVNAFASTPYNVAVGGTDFSDTYSGTNAIYWSSTNTSTFGSASSYIPEIPWNTSCAGVLLSNYLTGSGITYGADGFCNSQEGGFFLSTVAGGGGPSACATGSPSVPGVVDGTCQGWPKPSWQSTLSNLGNPNDGVRDTPDVSLFAANGLWSHYYVFCWSDTANGGAACSGAPSSWSGAGGTSFSSPIMAGIQALVNQKTGQRQGNPNPVYYQLAANEYNLNSSSCNSANGNGVASTCIFYDVTQGDMDVNCAGSNNCYLPSGTDGVLSTLDNSYNPSYGSATGWDFATGIGSVNAANLVNNWPTLSSSAVLMITKTHTGNFTQGQQHAIYTVTVSNGANSGPTSGTVMVTETQPLGLTLVSMAGAGWTCATNNCTRSDVLNGGASYPAITVTVNVATTASTPQVNLVSVSGGGTLTASATDSTTIIVTPAAPVGLSATAGTAQVTLSWNSSAGATSYNILRSTTSGGPYSTTASGVTTTSYTDTGLTSTTYYYVVQAVNAAGTSPNSNQASATPCSPLAVPTGLSSIAGNTQVSLSWSASSGAASYNVKRSTVSGGPYATIGGVTLTSYSDGGLTNGTTYYYVVSAVNACGQSGNSSQASVTPSGSWSWSSGYTYRRTITIDHTKVPNTDQLNFPVLFSGTYPYLATTANGGNVANANGYDILFTSDASGNSPLAYERESYSASNGAVNLWVRVPVLSHSNDTVIYMFYGNSSVTTDPSNGTGTWDSHFKAVWHLPNGIALSAADSTSNAVNGTNFGMTATAGLIGGAASGNGGAGQQINTANNPYSSSMFSSNGLTLSAWVKPVSNATTSQIVSLEGAYVIDVTAGKAGFEINGSGSDLVSAVSTPIGNWTHIVGTSDSSGNLKLYVNGVLNNTASQTFYSLDSLTRPYSLGGHPVFPGYNFNGVIDEVRISNVARSGDWIATEFNNQNSSSTFYTVDAAAASGGAPLAPNGLTAAAGNAQITLSWNPSSGATNYNVLRATTSGGPYTPIVTGLAATSYTDTSLTNGTTYYYVAQAVNAAGTSPNSSEASASPSGGLFWSSGYTYRRTITIDHTKVPNTDQLNFPVLFSGTYPYLATTANGGNVANANGYDILFTSDASGNSPLAYERESYSASNGAVNLWVRVPVLSHSNDTVIYMFYGNSSVTTDPSNGTGTWDSHFKAVWHLPNGIALSAADSTSNAVNGTNFGMTATAGLIGGAASGNGGAGQQINTANNPYSSSMFSSNGLTLSAWVKPVSNATTSQIVSLEGAYVIDVTAGKAGFEINGSGSDLVSAVSTPIGNWTHIVGTSDSSGNLKLYVNGVLNNTASQTFYSLDSLTRPYSLGGHPVFPGYNFNGVIDEVRISNVARSGDWIATEFNNQNSSSTFYTVDAAAASGGAPLAPNGLTAAAGNAQITLSWNPSSGATNYNVLRATTSGGPYTPIVTGLAATSYTDTSLTNGTTYYYVAQAVNAAGTSPNSNQASATLCSPLAVPTGLSSIAGNTQVSLSWSASSGAASYNVKRSTVSGGPYATIGGVTLTSYSDGGLTNGTTYYYVVSAVNACGQSGNSNEVSATPSGAFSNGYAFRRAITIDHTKVPNTDQLNFPVLISGTYSYLASAGNGGNVANANGYDILFTSDASGNSPLAYERESYSASNGAVNLWVRVSVLSHSSDTVIYMFYGNSLVTSDPSNGTGTWDSHFKAVWHLPNGIALSAADSTSNAVNGTNFGMTATAGLIGGAASGDGGAGHQINTANNPYSSSMFSSNGLTLSAWVKPVSNATTSQIVSLEGAYVIDVTAGNAGFEINGSGTDLISTASVPTGGWTYIVGTSDSSGNLKLYVNGVLDHSASQTFFNLDLLTRPYSLGGHPVFPGYNLNGVIDEVRISNIARSGDWIAAEYNNQNGSSALYAVGAATTSGP